MTDLVTSANKEFNNSFDETKCPLCNNQYDEEIRIPRILLNCGHTICSLCISSSNNSNSILKCPEDNTEYQNITLASFPINKALLRLLHKISESKKNNEENSLIKIVSIKTPKTSPEKRLNTARASRINLENLKLISNKKSEKCPEHPSRNLEMICLEDQCKICTNCAIFGKHKNHNVINIDEFVKDIELKAEKLIELFENISDGEIKKEIGIINDKSKNNLLNLLEVINDKYINMTNVIQDFTKNLIEKVKKDENILIGEISNQFDKLKERINYYLEFPEKIKVNVTEWKNRVQDNMGLLNEVKDLSNECLKFVDCYGDNSYNKLIKAGNNIVYDIQRIVSFPTDELQEEIKNLNLTIEKQILSQEFFHINKKLDFGDLCQKYEKEKSSTVKKDEIILDNDFKGITVFSENVDNKVNNKNKEKNNSLTDDSDNGNGNGNGKQCLEKSVSESFLRKEMEIENIQFGDDSFLFTDLDLIGLNFESKNKNNNLNGNNKKGQKMININTLDIDNNNDNATNNLKVKKIKFGHVKNIKSSDLTSYRNNITYDRDSLNISIKKTPENKKKTIKKTKSHINMNKTPISNKSKIKNKLGNNKMYNTNTIDTKSNHSLSPFNSTKRLLFKNKLRKTDKINLSRNNLNEEAILSLAQQIKNSKEKLKEIKLIKCGINNEGAMPLLKALENCVKLNFVNLANNSLDDKIVNNIINFLKKNNSVTSCYFTNNNFTTGSKEVIKSYNRNGKIKIFI